MCVIYVGNVSLSYDTYDICYHYEMKTLTESVENMQSDLGRLEAFCSNVLKRTYCLESVTDVQQMQEEVNETFKELSTFFVKRNTQRKRRAIDIIGK